ncbi:MAG: CRISPR-associated endonuclease Cas2 [Candidatus Electrothrix sp. YB6]
MTLRGALGYDCRGGSRIAPTFLLPDTMSNFSRYVIAYDISSQRERSRVSKVLTEYGFRVQKSVFECSLSAGGKAKMAAELAQLDLQSGYLYIYHLNKQAKRSEIGKAPPSPDSGFAFIV